MQTDSTDYNQAARDLFAQLGLDKLGSGQMKAGGQYNPLDPIYAREDGTAIYVGNEVAAKSRTMLSEVGITHVVNCTDDIPNYHEKGTGGTEALSYYRFPVSFWSRSVDRTHASVLAFTKNLWAFIDDAFQKGGSVLVHCLAGAHRAGTTGVLCLMHYGRMPYEHALPAAKKLRSAINPIGMLPGLLERYEAARLAGEGA